MRRLWIFTAAGEIPVNCALFPGRVTPLESPGGGAAAAIAVALEKS
jgi:hypothetical protein